MRHCLWKQTVRLLHPPVCQDMTWRVAENTEPDESLTSWLSVDRSCCALSRHQPRNVRIMMRIIFVFLFAYLSLVTADGLVVFIDARQFDIRHKLNAELVARVCHVNARIILSLIHPWGRIVLQNSYGRYLMHALRV